MRKQTDILQEKIVLRPYTSKTRPVPNSAECPTVRKDPALLNILTVGDSVITRLGARSADTQTANVSNSGFSFPASNLNLAPSNSGFSYPASNLNVAPSNSGHVQSMSASITASPNIFQKPGSSEHVAVSKTGLSKDRFASNSVLQQPNFLARSRNSASNCSTANATISVPEREDMKKGVPQVGVDPMEKTRQVDVDPMERTRRVEAYMKAFQSGWKRSRDGTWVKDESAEFDSDEEPPEV